MNLAMTPIRRSRSRLRPALWIAIPLAVPAGIALAQASQFEPGSLGAVITEVTPEIAERHGFDRPGGAYVLEVEDGSPADREGLLEGDIITQFEHRTVYSAAELNGWIRREGAGSTVSMHVWRDGGESWLGLLTLEARPNPVAVGDAFQELRETIENLRVDVENLRATGLEQERTLAVLRVEVRDLRDQVRELRGRSRLRAQRTPGAPESAPVAPDSPAPAPPPSAPPPSAP